MLFSVATICLLHACKSFPTTGLDMHWGFQGVEATEFLDSRNRKVVRLSALCTGLLYPEEGFVVLISVRCWVDPRATMRPEGLSHWNIPVTPSGIDPAAFSACSAVRQPTAPQRTPFYMHIRTLIQNTHTSRSQISIYHIMLRNPHAEKYECSRT
jgi:hypothetical protein